MPDVVGFIEECLTHVKGEWAGQPFILEDWQRDEIIRPIFEEKRKDGTRRYRKVYIELPRKNGKSTLSAAIGLGVLFTDDEPGAEVYSCAADRDQAAIVFDVAKSMVENSPDLAAVSKRFRRSIVYKDRSYKVLSADAPTKHGLNSHCVIFDELHAQPNRDLWDVMESSMGSRRQPLLVMITTAGYDRNSICWEMHHYAIKVRDGIIEDPSFLPIIYAADEGEDWTAEETWKKANPGLGVSVKLDYLRESCATAQEIPAKQNTFRRLHLNQWTEQDVRWLDMGRWDDCAGQVNEAELLGLPCFGGLDLASTTDIAAFEAVFPTDEGFSVISRYWVPEENIEKRSKAGVPYAQWAREGLIVATPGNVIDYDWIRKDLNEFNEQYRVIELAIDRWNATQLSTQLDGDGFTVVPFGQGFASMAAPTRELETLMLARRLAHGGNAVLRWMASNASVKQDPAGNIKPDKSKSSEKIDGIVALIMAIGRATLQGTPGSVYDTRGIPWN